MEKTVGILAVLCVFTTSIATSRALPIDYDDEVDGNLIIDKDIAYLQSYDDLLNLQTYNQVVKRVPEMLETSDKRNIISALRAKIRRSKPSDVEDKFRFSPVLSVDALGNLNGFFDNLATNLHTMESRNLLPNQMRLLGENDRFRPEFTPAFLNSVRSYRSPSHMRKLLEYVPGTRLPCSGHH